MRERVTRFVVRSALLSGRPITAGRERSRPASAQRRAATTKCTRTRDNGVIVLDADIRSGTQGCTNIIGARDRETPLRKGERGQERAGERALDEFSRLLL